MTRTPFHLLLRTLIAKARSTKTEFARALGITPSALSRLLRPGGRRAPLDLWLCLRLAQLTRTDPYQILHALGQDDDAALLRSVFGPVPHRGPDVSVTLREQRVLRLLRELPPREARAVTLILEAVAAENHATTKTHDTGGKHAAARARKDSRRRFTTGTAKDAPNAAAS
jgi:hypothetical protein